jgi:K+-sensing histidine kinase KdpD
LPVRGISPFRIAGIPGWGVLSAYYGERWRDEEEIAMPTSARRAGAVVQGLRRLRAARYAAAVVAVGLALLLQMLLVPWFGSPPNQSPFMVFFAALVVAAWFGGLGPGLFSVGLAALLSWYFFLSPRSRSLSIPSGRVCTSSCSWWKGW